MSWKTDIDDRPLSVEPVKLVAVDLDGTLLRCDGSICARSAEALGEAAQRGVKVVLASARAPLKMKAVHAALGLDTLMIAQNGAVIYDPESKQNLVHETMPGELARRVIEIGRSVSPDLAVGVDVYGKTYTDRSRGRRRAAGAAPGQPAPHMPPPAGGGLDDTPTHARAVAAADMDNPVGTLDALLTDPVTKVMMIGPPDVLGGVQLSLHRELADQVAFAFSELKLLQVVTGGVDKAKALAYIAAHYDIPRPSVLAIGDAPNDIGMLKWAGYSVALANAWKEVRDAAHFICPTNDDAGVAEAIRKYVL